MDGAYDPRTDPARHCLRLAAWPDADQRACRAPVEPGDILDPGGAAAAWAAHTQMAAISAYGRWLNWLRTQGHLDAHAVPADRVTLEAVAAYVEDLQRVNAPSTVLVWVQYLTASLAVMTPGMDWEWLWKFGRRLKRKAHPVCSKGDRLVPQATLLALGRQLMAEAESRCQGAASRRAVRYRDGLMIAVLAARPLRRRNFTSIEIDRHLLCSGAGYVLQFAARETKTRMPLEFPFPANLVAALERYLSHYRPLLLDRAEVGRGPRGRGTAGKALWVSSEGSAMSETGIYGRFVRLTATMLGDG